MTSGIKAWDVMVSGLPMRYLLVEYGGSEVGIEATSLEFLVICQSGLSWENTYGTTIEGFCMGDGHQQLSARVVARLAPASCSG
jgi:hypothetical protein